MEDTTRRTRLHLVRHGATPLTAEDRFSGGDNVHLSDEGTPSPFFLAPAIVR